MYLMEGLLSLGISITATLLYESVHNKLLRFMRAIMLRSKLKKYTSSFIDNCNLTDITKTLNLPLFCEAISSKKMSAYTNSLKKCKDLDDLNNIIEQMAYYCYQFIEDSIENNSRAYNKIKILLSKYIYGFIKQFSSLFPDSTLPISAHLTLLESKLCEEVEEINSKLDMLTPNFLNATGNAEFYSKEFLRPMFYEYKYIHDHNVATRRDCYTTPEYCIRSDAFFTSTTPDMFVLLEYIFCGQFSGQISGICTPIKDELNFMKNLRKENDRFILIIGTPGIGKTSLFYKFAYEKATTNYCENYKFLGVKMRELAADGSISPQFPLAPIIKHLKCDLATLENSILFLDGLDELLSMRDIADYKNEFIKNLFAYIKQVKNCKLIITTRPFQDIDFYSYKILVIELLPLSIKRQTEFCESYVYIHPSAKSYSEKLLAKKLYPLELPIALYICLALKIELGNERNTLGDILEQLFLQIEERNYDGSLTYLGNIIEPRFVAQEIAVAMMAEGHDILENEKTLCVLKNYYVNTDNVELFKLAKNIYGLTFYYMNHTYATEFFHKSFAEFLAAEKIEKEAYLLLRSKGDASKALRKWYELFSYFDFSESVLQFYSYKIEKNESQDILKSVESFINTSLSKDWLANISEFNSEKIIIYIKNILNLRRSYLNCFAGSNINLNSECLIRCLSICNAQGSDANHLSFIQMSFGVDIQYLHSDYSIFQNCRFKNMKIQACHFISKYAYVTFLNVTFTQDSFPKASFYYCNFIKCKFIGCNFTQAAFSHCEFQQTKFDMCYLGNAKMVNTSFTFCEFRDSVLKSVSLRQISNCIFCNVDISSADFRGADLRTSKLSSLHMEGVLGVGFIDRHIGIFSNESIGTFSNSSILLSQVKYIYQFIHSITDVRVFDDGQPTEEVNPTIAECEFCYCLGVPISKEALKFVADTYSWPDGIQIEENYTPRWPYSRYFIGKPNATQNGRDDHD